MLYRHDKHCEFAKAPVDFLRSPPIIPLVFGPCLFLTASIDRALCVVEIKRNTHIYDCFSTVFGLFLVSQSVSQCMDVSKNGAHNPECPVDSNGLTPSIFRTETKSQHRDRKHSWQLQAPLTRRATSFLVCHAGVVGSSLLAPSGGAGNRSDRKFNCHIPNKVCMLFEIVKTIPSLNCTRPAPNPAGSG